MRTISSLTGILLGALIIITSLQHALVHVTASSNQGIQALFGWSIMAVLGLYLLGWGLMKFMMGGDEQTDRPTPPKRQTGIASSHSKTRNRSG